MTMTELVPYDPAFARFQTTGLPVLHAQLRADLIGFTVEPEHDVNWRWFEPSPDDLDGLDALDYERQLDPTIVESKQYLDAFEHEHLVETGRLPRAQWYADARQALRRKAHLARQAKLTREWAAGLDGGTFSLGDGDDSTCSGTEDFADSIVPVGKVRVKTITTRSGRRITVKSAFDTSGQLIEPTEPLSSRVSAERYRDTSVAETAIFHPNKGDGLTLDEMLSDMRRFETVVPTDDGGDPIDGVDPRYGAHPEPAQRIRKMRTVIEHAELRARAVEICRFPWNDERAAQSDKMARGWVRRSRLLEWGTDTWQVILTRKCKPVNHLLDGPGVTNFWTVFVRTHTGSETVRREGRPDLQVWTWAPHYYAVFADEETATQFLERLEAAFLRERHGDLDDERWPNDLVNDRSVAAAQAGAQWKLWAARNRDGWHRINMDSQPAPGALTFEPEQPQVWDPTALAERLDGEYARYEAAE